MRREAGRVRHRDAGPAQRAFKRAPEVSVAGETGAASLGIPDSQPLHRRRVLLGLSA